MAQCECIPTCPFFNDKMGDRPAMAEMLKNQYCKKNLADCARYIVRDKLGPDMVPADMFPGQKW